MRRGGGGETVFVIMASTSWSGHRLYEQRLAAALGRSHRVVYVEPPSHPFHPTTPSAELPPGVETVRPWTLPYGRRWLGWLTGVVAGLWVRWRLAPASREVVVVSTSMHPATRWLLSSWPAIALVKDDYVAGASLLRANAALMRRRRDVSLRRADLVVVVSPVLADLVETVTGRRPEVVPAGCDIADVQHPQPPELEGVSRPRAVFIGLMSDRIDFDHFEAAARSGYTVVTVGDVQTSFSAHARLQQLRAAGGLVEVPGTTSARVTAFLQHCDVGLVPYTLSAFNQASFPLKTLEYLAAGLPVVGADLASLRWLEAPYVLTGPTDRVPDMLRALRDIDPDDIAARCRQFASEQTWERRAHRYLELASVVRANETLS